MELDQQIKQVERKKLLVMLIDMPGMIMLALGLYAKFGANGEPFHPLLADPTVINILLFGGGLLAALGGISMARLALKIQRLQHQKAQAAALVQAAKHAKQHST